MSPAIVKSKQSQVEIFRQLQARMKMRFARHAVGNANNLRGYEGSDDFAPFGLDFWTGLNWIGFDLWGPPIDGSPDSRRVLGFATYSPNSRTGLTAAALARDAQGIALYHDGRVFTRDGRARPYRNEPMTDVNGRLYHRIGYVDDDHFFDRLMEYHFSRLNSNLGSNKNGVQKKAKGSGMDAGPARGGVRSSAVFTAHHNPLTIALGERLEGLGYVPRTCGGVTPDLLVEKNGKSVLFEVKPSALTHDLILACGQVLVYNEHADADRKVIVSAKANLSGYGSGIARVLKKFDIGFVVYRKTRKGYVFDGLERVLPV